MHSLSSKHWLWHICYLGSCETKFKDRFENHKKLFNHAKQKMTRNYQKNLEKSKSAMEHEKSHGKLSQYVDLTIQTVSVAFYVSMRNEIAT